MTLESLLNHENIGRIRFDEPLRNHCYWHIGGAAWAMVEPESVEHVANLRRFLSCADIPWMTVGDGTNLLFDDAGFDGVVIKISRALSVMTIDGRRIDAQAGVWIPWMARASARAGLTGLEHTIGIPGALGGLVAMNGGSLQQSIGESIVSVSVVDASGAVIEMSKEDCEFDYRSSALQRMDVIVVGARLELQPADARQVRRKMLEILQGRRRNFPLKTPNCGSVFVRDMDMYNRFGPPGKVIEETGLKGLRVGDAEVSHRHANFIVNKGRATSADVLELIRQIRERVHERTGMWLRCEVRHVSPQGRTRSAHEAL